MELEGAVMEMSEVMSLGSNHWMSLITTCPSGLLPISNLLGQAEAVPQDVGLLAGLFQAFVVGIVQGITEFLPISSTAHLQVVTNAFKWTSVGSKTFVATIQFGSVIAVIMYFWKDIVTILSGGYTAFRERNFEREEWKLLVGIAIGTIPALAGGLLIKKWLNDESSALNSMTTIAITSIIMALLLAAAEQLGSRKRGFETLTIRDGILIGLGQMIALIPGASRSGSTLTTALFLGLERQTAARYSFLLGIPTLTIATVYEFFKEALGKIDLWLVLMGTASAFVFSYLSIVWLLRFLQTRNTWVFVWYRLAFGVTVLIAVATRLMDNNLKL